MIRKLLGNILIYLWLCNLGQAIVVMTRCTLYRHLISILFWIFAKIEIRHEMVFVKMAGIQIIAPT